MNLDSHVVRALVASVPVGFLLGGSVTLCRRRTALSSFLQLLGTGCLVIVVLAHICEALHLLPSMGWGLDRSLGHYLDAWSLVLGLTSFPLGYLLHALSLESQ